MKTLVQRFQQLHNDEAGQGLIEYVMLIALVISAAAACFPGLATALTMLSRTLAPSWARTSPNASSGRHGSSPNFCLLRLVRAGANTTQTLTRHAPPVIRSAVQNLRHILALLRWIVWISIFCFAL